jgi:hypothetical protein
MAYKQQFKDLGAADPEVKVPAAIRAAAARADALHQQSYQTEPPVDENKEGAAEEGKPNGTEGQSQKAEPENPVQPPAGKEGDPAPAQNGSDDWQHKYNSIKGRYDRSEQTIAGLNNRIGQLEALLARANAAPAPAPTPANPDLKFKGVSPEDRENFGDDFIDLAQRAAMEKLNPELASLRRELEGLKGSVGNVAQQTQEQVRQNMYSFLSSNQENWRELNKRPDFVAWTNLPDPFSGAIRGDLMRDAFAKGDAQRVLQFFKGFLADEAATDPATIKPDPKTGKVSLEEFAAPGRAKAPAASTPPGEKETITHAQIANFYTLVQKGHYKGNPAEKDRLEQMIFAAQAEGRVV